MNAVIKSFIERNKVFLLGLLGSIALVLQQYADDSAISLKIIAYAVFVATCTYFARNARGQWQTVGAALGTLASTLLTMEQSGAISWAQLLLQGIIVLIGIATGPIKSVGYERTEVIQQAKNEGQEIVKEAEKKPPVTDEL